MPLISHNTLALSFDKSATVVLSFHLVSGSRLMLVCACMSLCMQIFGTDSLECIHAIKDYALCMQKCWEVTHIMCMQYYKYFDSFVEIL